MCEIYIYIYRYPFKGCCSNGDCQPFIYHNNSVTLAECKSLCLTFIDPNGRDCVAYEFHDNAWSTCYTNL